MKTPFGILSGIALLIPISLPAAIFSVSNTNVTGLGSLQQALFDANTNSGADVITFNILSGGLTISPAAALPVITDPVTIDGATQPGFAGVPLIELNGTSAGAAADGLKIATSNCVVRSLIINRFVGDGIEITNGANNLIEGCYIGLSANGLLDQGNTLNGILVTNAAGNMIGGIGTTNRNYISGNTQSGINLGGNTATNNTLLGNYIGLNVTNGAIANSADGVRVNAAFAIIGGTVNGARNVISGNTGQGIEVTVSGLGAVIQGNYIGTDDTGNLDRGNTLDGILVNGGTVKVGGGNPGEGNLIAGNNDDGIELNGLSSTNHLVQGNVIGAASAFVSGVINGGNGILITTSSRSNIIGGIVAGQPNTIYFNTGDGINVVAANANTNNSFRGNLIFGNGASGIDLGAAGITANDGGDADVGANQLQNFPVLTSVSNTATEVFITGTLNSRASTTYGIDFYSSIEADTVLNGEGQFYIGSTNLATDGGGNLAFTIGFPVPLQGRHVTATATDPYGNTSEFSAATASLSLAVGQVFTVVNTNDSGAGSLREAINQANLAATTGDTIEFAITNLATVIAPASALPEITDPVVIDGYTQPGAAVNTSLSAFNGTVLVRIAGASAGTGANGLTITTSNCIVRGLMVTGFTGTGADGIEISGPGGNTIEGCLIGIDAASTDQGNAANGVFISGSPNNIIGGSTAATRNVISGNQSDGVEINGAGATGNQVLGNLIGTALSGATAVANSADGVLVSGAGGNIIGSATAGAGNLISGNASDGIELTGLATTNTTVLGNRIGTEATGGSALANSVHGVNINTSSRSNVIGGVLAGFANTIAFNGQDGVNIAAAAANTNNVIRGNSIFSNGTTTGELGIDLGAANVTANDLGDPDTGANQLQNFPVLAWVTNTVTETSFSGSLNSKPATTYTIDFYANVLPDTDGVGEGQYYLGATNLTTGADSNLTFTVSLPVASLPARYITATATDPFGNTSEFGTNVFAQSSVPGTTFMVINTNDSGAGSLRQAIIDANANISAGDTIAFAITNLSTVIFPASALPTIIDPVVIDGSTQSGSSVNTSATAFNGTVLVRLDGSFAPSGTDGLKFAIGNNTVRGLAIFDFAGTAGDGLDFSGGDNNTVQGCIIGLDVDGTDHGNGGNGILITSSTNNLIGGALPAQRNVISGNTSEGIEISGAASSGNQILGNLIGTDFTGTIARANAGGGVLLTTVPGATIGGATSAARNVISGNTGTGIELASGCSGTTIQNNFIGTDVSGALDLGNSTDGISITASSNSVVTANVISGNNSDGILISGATARNNTVTTNRIGTDVSGLVSLGNGDNGVLISSASFNTIGGATAADGNLISANVGDGIEITGATASNNIVCFNLIGTDLSGGADLGNDDNGILIQTSAHDNRIGAGANVIAFNTLDGVFISGGTNNALRENLIFANGDLAVDLGTAGITANDATDTDTGANQLQNFPVLTAATNSATNVVIVGTLSSAASTTYVLDFYANYAPDASGHGEAEQFLGSLTNTTDGAGNLNFTADFPVAVTGRYLTATATDPFGNTSELAASFRPTSVIPPITYTVVNVNDSGAGSLRAAIQACNAALSSGNNVIEFNIPGAGPHTIQPLTKLTSILNQTTIAGDTQPGYSGTPLIVLNGALAGGTGTDGLQISAGACVVRALTINGFTGDGIELGVEGANQIEACYIGLDATGTIAVTNLQNGILITNSAANIIGGSVAGQRNFIAGNAQAGIQIGGVAAISNNIVNNALGLNVAGIAQPNQYGIRVRAPKNVIGGTNSGARNIISGNGTAGVYLDTSSASNNIVQGNYVGLDLSGLNAVTTQPNGIYLSSAPENQIGGIVAGAGNFVAGNSSVNVYLVNSATKSNLVQGNYIGLNVAGSRTAQGAEYGVYISGATLNTIGGTAAAERNIISGNTNLSFGNLVGTGIYISSSSHTNIVRGNFIGTDPTGTFAMPNNVGIWVVGGNGTIIGGSESGAGNLISGNLEDGIELQVAVGVVIQGNKIGTDVTGTLPIANGSTLTIGGSGIAALNNTTRALIGGTNAGEGNIIAFNTGAGIAVADTFTTGGTRENAIWGNSIFSNAVKGISLQSAGPLPNDFGDPDNGPNRKQNYPVLALALTDTNTTSISGTLNSLSNAVFRLEFFDNAAAETNGYGEGQTYLGATEVTTDASGNASFIFTHPAGLLYNHVVTATATDSNRNTSEFSASVRVLPWDSYDLGVSITDSLDPIGAGLPLTYTLVITNQGPTNALSVLVTNVLPAGVTFVTATPSQGTYSQSGGVVICNLGTISSNAFATVTIDIVPPNVGTLSNFATVTAAGFDHNSANNSDGESTTTLAIADVALTVSESADPIGSGQFVTYTVIVTNQGPSPSSLLSLQQDLDPDFLITAVSLSQGSLTQLGNTLICDFGGMAANGSATLTVTCLATATGTNFANAFLSWGDYDPNPANNTFAETTVVTNGPGILQFTSATRTVSEAAATILLGVERLYGTAGTIGATVATTNGSALAGADYTSTVVALTFTNGETLKTFTVPINNDLLAECNEDFAAQLLNPVGGTLLLFDTNTVVTIFDNEVSPSGTVLAVSATDTNLPLDPGDNDSLKSSVSAAGRYVAFNSYAANLVADDFNGSRDVFVRDLVTQTTMLASRALGSSASANGPSFDALISGNGRYVVFNSYATDLVLPDANENRDVFVRDLQTSTTTLVSKNVAGTGSANDYSTTAEPIRTLISSNGQGIVYTSYATDLTTLADANFSEDVFYFNLAAGTNRLLSVNLAGTDAGNDWSVDPVISANGQVVAFESAATDLVALADANGGGDVFAQDLATGLNELVSVNLSATGAASGLSSSPYLSQDGRYVAFQSSGSNLATNDTNTRVDVFRRDRLSGVTTLVSVNTNGVAGNSSSTVRGISADGRFVVFSSYSFDLVAADYNGSEDVFVRDLVSNVTLLVSRTPGGDVGNFGSFNPVISGDGTHVAFESYATDLTTATKSGGYVDVFVRNLTNGLMRLVSFRNGSTNGPNADSYDAAISYNGNVTSFTGDPEGGGIGESLLALSGSIDYSDIWAHTFASNTTELVSVSAFSATGNGYSYDPKVSADGNHVVFVSVAENLASGDTNQTTDVFLYNLTNQTLTIVSLNLGNTSSGNGYSDVPDVSADGRYVAFYSTASDLVAGDTNNVGDIFRRDLLTSTTALVSVGGNGLGNSDSYDPDLTPDGRYLAFETTATNLFANDLNGAIDDVVLRDMTGSGVELISVNAAGTGSGSSTSYDPVISDDGRFVAYESFATNLVNGDTNGLFDVFVRDRVLGTTLLCSRDLSGTGSGSLESYDPIISANGQIVVFFSHATNLVAGDTNNSSDLFAFNTATHTVQLITRALDGGMANDGSYNYSISADGRYVAFESYATNLVANDDNGANGDIFLRDLLAGTTTLISGACDGSGSGNSYSSNPQISADGRYITFQSAANDLVAGFFTAGAENVYRHDRLTGETVLVSQNQFVSGGGNGSSYASDVSGTGGTVVFVSDASNLAAEDANNTADIFVWQGNVVASGVNLVLVKDAATNSVLQGANFSYTLTATNYGSASATGVMVSDPLPAGVSFVSATTSQGTVTNASGTVIATLGSLGVNAGASITINVTAVNAGSISNYASVAATEPDDVPGNNSDFAVVTVTAFAPPTLSILPTNSTQVLIAWPASTPAGYGLETATNLVPVIAWIPVTNSVIVSGTNKLVILDVNFAEPQRYYRLKQ